MAVKNDRDEHERVKPEEHIKEVAQGVKLWVLNLSVSFTEKKPNREKSVLDAVVRKKCWPSNRIICVGVSCTKDFEESIHQDEPGDDHCHHDEGHYRKDHFHPFTEQCYQSYFSFFTG